LGWGLQNTAEKIQLYLPHFLKSKVSADTKAILGPSYGSFKESGGIKTEYSP
jgi:hypothetical protein